MNACSEKSVHLEERGNSVAIDFNEKIYILDGAMGTMLQRAGMSPEETTTQFGMAHPDIWRDIYTQYIDAGSDIIY
ncbi:MAG: homocysteine S-methyltransferase family protein, partial [Clostridia bacterium]